MEDKFDELAVELGEELSTVVEEWKEKHSEEPDTLLKEVIEVIAKELIENEW